MKDYWFWRDSNGHEIDLLTESGNLLDIFEIKSTQTIMPDLFKGLKYFSDEFPQLVKDKTLIYGGNENQERTNYRVKAWAGI